MNDVGRAQADRMIDDLDEPRRTAMRHLHEVILEALPGIDVTLYTYGGALIGYGSYDYSTGKGPAGRWFSVGLANRKRYISLYSAATGTGGYLVESMLDRFPGTTAGKSCLNITKPELVDDEAVRELARRSWEQFKDGFHRPG